MQNFHYNKLETLQSESIPGEKQVKNSAGGYVYQIDCFQQLERFLILSTAGGTYYATEKKLSKENAAVVEECLKENACTTIDTIVEISEGGKAVNNDPAIFALAIAASNENVNCRRAAFDALPHVCRIPTHLFHFMEYLKGLRGFGGSGLRKAVAKWYTEKNPDKLAYHMVKYQQRDGWSNRDVLRKAHPVAPTKEHEAIFRWVTHGSVDSYIQKTAKVPRFHNALPPEDLPQIIHVFEEVKHLGGSKMTDRVKIIDAITDHGLTREMIPTEALAHTTVWAALLEKMPMTAMIRNLGVMTSIGLLKQGKCSSVDHVVNRLRNEDYLRKARVHPMTIVNALNIYGQGHGIKGSKTWDPVGKIKTALDDAFYKAFDFVEPTGKHIQLAIDVSGSMRDASWSSTNNNGIYIAGTCLTPREAAAVLAMVVARTEENHYFTAFSDKMVPLSITDRTRLEDVLKITSGLPFNRTDCALPMLYALDKNIETDAFVILTDNETWCGSIHPTQALEKYRKKFGPTKMITVGMTATNFSIADPNDAGMLDVVGLSTTTPSVISEFIR